jgi:uncharacterized protein YcgI (DUF1989 family)
MSKRFLTFFAALCLLVGSTACSHFKSSKPKKPVESKTPAAELEADYKVRWIAKRSSELVTQGQSPEAAKDQATREFAERMPYVGVRH